MIDRKMLMMVIVTGVLILGAPSCSRQPVACFTTSINVDSIHVNQPVTFNATCSINAGSYNWQFYNNPDSVAFTPIVTKAFTDTGAIDVYLLVTSGNDYAGYDQTITVLH